MNPAKKLTIIGWLTVFTVGPVRFLFLFGSAAAQALLFVAGNAASAFRGEVIE